MIPVLAVLSIIFFRIISHSFGKLREQEGIIVHSIREYISSVRIVKAFARQEFEKEKFDIQNRKKLDIAKKWRLYFSFFWPASHLICVFQMTAALLLSGLMTCDGRITIGTFLAYNGLLNGIIWPLQHLGKLISELSMGFVSYGRIASVLNEPAEDLHRGERRERLEGRIEFRNVGFSFRHDVPVLHDVSFVCNPGEVIVITGETGSGKSTLISLLPRFYEPTQGTILIDNVPAERYSKYFLRKQIGIAGQSPFLFSATVEENISYGSGEPVTHDAVIKAATAACIHDDIAGFPQAYGTIVGEKGVMLSGGQKQRISLARTLLKNPSILVLDDIASSVDTETDSRIRRMLREKLKGRSVIIITHRIMHFSGADRILVMKHGTIAEQGTHEELLAKDGEYRKMYDQQERIETALNREVEDARQGL